MKSARLILALAFISLLLTACVPSLQPLYTPETTVFREDLIGIWKEKPQDENESWTFTKGENNSYTLVVQEKEASSKFQVHLVKLGDALFLDLYPDGEVLNNTRIGDLYKSTLIPGHLIMKIKLGANLQLQFIEPDRLKEQLAGGDVLAHTFIEKEHLIITASTPELQKFFKKHASNEKLWDDSGTLEKLVL